MNSDLEEDLRRADEYEQLRKAFDDPAGTAEDREACRQLRGHYDAYTRRRFPVVVRELLAARAEVDRLDYHESDCECRCRVKEEDFRG